MTRDQGAAIRPRHRHQATRSAWAWLENGPGILRSKEDREHIREILVKLDADLHQMDVERHRAR